jgi:hypothetical protein
LQLMFVFVWLELKFTCFNKLILWCSLCCFDVYLISKLCFFYCWLFLYIILFYKFMYFCDFSVSNDQICAYTHQQTFYFLRIVHFNCSVCVVDVQRTKTMMCSICCWYTLSNNTLYIQNYSYCCLKK